MAFRTVVVKEHCKLEYSLNYLVYRTGDDTKRIFLDEIHTLILQSTAISITTALLQELTNRKVKVIFCDEKHNPSSELLPFYNAHNSSRKIREQIQWSEDIKGEVWRQIVRNKITNQAYTLHRQGKEEKCRQLLEYASDVQRHDMTNREGHAAKVYFNNVYFEGFTREKECPINTYLNYGYTILLSEFNRIITANGYITQLGIHHCNDYNDFNLSCDLIEPFRYLVDELASKISEKDDFKNIMIHLLEADVEIDGKTQSLVNAITIYSNSVFSALQEKDLGLIKFLTNGI